MRTQRSTTAMLAGLVSFCLTSPALADAPDVSTLRPAEFEIIAWSEDSEQFLVKVKDPNAGTLFQVRDTKSNEIVRKGTKALVFPSPSIDDEPKLIKKIIAQNALKQPIVEGSAHPKKSDIMLMTAQKGDKFYIMGVKGERASKYDTIDVIKDKANVAKVYQKQLVWDQDGKNFILVYHAKLEGGEIPFEGDFIVSYKFKAFKVKGSSGDDDDGGDD